MDRIREGFSKVMDSTGYDYMGDVPEPAGKTGSAETFKDTDNDGLIDKETLSKATTFSLLPFLIYILETFFKEIMMEL